MLIMSVLICYVPIKGHFTWQPWRMGWVKYWDVQYEYYIKFNFSLREYKSCDPSNWWSASRFFFKVQCDLKWYNHWSSNKETEEEKGNEVIDEMLGANWIQTVTSKGNSIV